MKNIIYTITALVIGSANWAAPLDKSSVSGDAQWLAHIDLEAFTESALGDYAMGILKEEIAKNNDTPISVDIDLVAQEIHSLTAFGTSLTENPEENSVLIVKTGNRARSIIDGYIATAELETDGKTGIKRLEDKDIDTYLIGNELYASFLRDDVWVSSKSYDQIEKVQSVINGRSDNLTDTDSRLLVKDDPGFFFLATAEGFDKLGDMPAQARVLQKAQGGQIAFGERGDMFLANLALLTPDPDVSSQLSRIIQGMVALASFAEIGDERLDTLMNNLAVEEADRHVSINLEYPVSGLINILSTLAAEAEDAFDDKKSEDNKI